MHNTKRLCSSEAVQKDRPFILSVLFIARYSIYETSTVQLFLVFASEFSKMLRSLFTCVLMLFLLFLFL